MLYLKTGMQNILSSMLEGNELKANVAEDNEEYVITIDAAGIEKNQISIDAYNDIIDVTLNYPCECEQQEYIIKELRCGSYNRQFQLKGIDYSKASASLNNGLLNIKVKKMIKSNHSQINVE